MEILEPMTAGIMEPMTAGITEPMTAGITESMAAGITDPMTAGITEPITDGITEPMTAGQMVDHMYQYVYSVASERRLEQTLKALPLMRSLHGAQTRIGTTGKIPYIVHPLTIAYQCLALGLVEDELLAAALLHDVVEDCGVTLAELPISEPVKIALGKLTFVIRTDETRAQAKARYYEAIPGNRIAMIVKVLDRCNNISTMSMCFSRQKMLDYMDETKQYVLPLLKQVEEQYPECYNASFLIKYHILSVLESVKYLLLNGGCGV